MAIDSLLEDWKLTALSFFLHGSFVLRYADSSNQRHFFLCGSFVLGIYPTNLRNKSKLFQCSSLFVLAFVSSLLHKVYGLIIFKSNLLVYSLYYAEACNELAGPISAPLAPGHHCSFRRNVTAVASRWQHCVRFDPPEI